MCATQPSPILMPVPEGRSAFDCYAAWQSGKIAPSALHSGPGAVQPVRTRLAERVCSKADGAA